MKNEICITQKPTGDEILKIQKLETLLNMSKNIYFKIDPQSFSHDDEKSNHILCYRKNDLVGYTLMTCFNSEEIELTSISNDKISFFDMYEIILKVVKENNIKKFLFIVDRNDISTSIFIKDLKFSLSFSECRMNFNENNFNFHENNDISLRNATINDLESIVYLEDYNFGNSDNICDIQTYDISNVKVAILDSEIIGKIKVESNDGIVGIYAFVVNPKYRGKGFGRKILNSVIEDILECGYTKLYLEVDYENFIALSLYKSVGFEIQTVFDYYQCII